MKKALISILLFLPILAFSQTDPAPVDPVPKSLTSYRKIVGTDTMYYAFISSKWYNVVGRTYLNTRLSPLALKDSALNLNKNLYDVPSKSTALLNLGGEALSNKATTFGTLNNTLYPTTQAVANYVTAGFVPTTLSPSLVAIGASSGGGLTQNSRFGIYSNQFIMGDSANLTDNTLLINGLGIYNASSWRHNSYSNSSSGGAKIDFNRYRGTISAPTQVMSGDALFNITTRAYTNTAARTPSDQGATIIARANEDQTTTSFSNQLEFYTTPTASVTNARRLTINSNGNVSLGTGTNPASALFDMGTGTSKGFLFGRFTTTQRDAIASPVEGLTVGNTTTSTQDYYSGSSWQTTAYLTRTQTFTNKTIAAGSNTITGLTNTNLSGSAAISNANLANSSITVQGSAVSLGGSVNPINGTGFVKATGTTISYDNSTYLTTASAASSYAQLGTANTFTGGQQTFGTSNNTTAINGNTLAFYGADFSILRPVVQFNNVATGAVMSLRPPTSFTTGRAIELPDASGTIALTSSLPIAGSFSGVGTATTTFTVTIGTTMANTTYKVNATPTSALSAALFYVTNKTTTTFDVVYLAGLTGTIQFDWSVFP